jgi:hypothetical protein
VHPVTHFACTIFGLPRRHVDNSSDYSLNSRFLSGSETNGGFNCVSDVILMGLSLLIMWFSDIPEATLSLSNALKTLLESFSSLPKTPGTYLVINKSSYRLLSLFGTGFLIISIVALTNAQVQFQIAYAAAYATFTVAYWTAVAALPNKMHWEISCFSESAQKIGESKRKSGSMTEAHRLRTCTIALWEPIVVTKSVEWIKWSNAVSHSKI